MGQKLYDFIEIKQSMEKENGFLSHGIVQNVVMCIRSLLTHFCIRLEMKSIKNHSKENVQNVILNSFGYFAIKTLCMENKSGFLLHGIALDVSMFGWIKNKTKSICYP